MKPLAAGVCTRRYQPVHNKLEKGWTKGGGSAITNMQREEE